MNYSYYSIHLSIPCKNPITVTLTCTLKCAIKNINSVCLVQF